MSAPLPTPPPRRQGHRLRLALGLVVGGLALTWALWDVPLDEVGRSLQAARKPPLLLVAAIFFWQQGMRAWRQMLILRTVAPHSSYRTNLSILCVSFLAINTLPARLGEIVRPLLLLEREGIPLGTGFALVFLERVLDLCATLLMLGIVAWWLGDPLGDAIGLDPQWIRVGRIAAGGLVLGAASGLGVLVVFGRPLLARLQPLAGRGPRAWQPGARLVLGFAATFLRGLDALRSPRRVAAVLLLTAVTWGLSVWMLPIAARAFGFGSMLGYPQGMGVLAIVMLGGVVPAPPGMAGTYEAFVRAGLALFGVSGPAPTPAGGSTSLDAAAVAFALTLHWGLYLVQAATAAWFLATDHIDLRRLLRRALQGTDEAPTPD